MQTISPGDHVHIFRLTSLADVDDDLGRWMTDAYAVGEQRHLR